MLAAEIGNFFDFRGSVAKLAAWYQRMVWEFATNMYWCSKQLGAFRNLAGWYLLASFAYVILAAHSDDYLYPSDTSLRVRAKQYESRLSATMFRDPHVVSYLGPQLIRRISRPSFFKNWFKISWNKQGFFHSSFLECQLLKLPLALSVACQLTAGQLHTLNF